MTEEKKPPQADLQLGEDNGSHAGIVIAVIITSLFFIAAFGAFLYFDRTGRNADEAETRLTPGYFTPGMIRDIFAAMDSHDEFTFPPIVSRENESRFLGEELHRERDILQVYAAIRSYRQPEQPSIVKDKLEKLYYLYINRAESAERSRNFKRALYYYRKAEKLKPGRREIVRVIDLTERTIAAIDLREDDDKSRSYPAIKYAVESKLAHFKYLYSRELDVSPDTRGELSIELFIKPSGRISRAGIIESTLGNEAFENRILGHIRMWNFGVVEAQKDDTCVMLRLYFKGQNTITVYVGELCETDGT